MSRSFENGADWRWSVLVCIVIAAFLGVGVATSELRLAQTLTDAGTYTALAFALGVVAIAAALFRVNPANVLICVVGLLAAIFTGFSSLVAVGAIGLACAASGRRVASRFGVDDLFAAAFIGVFILTGAVGWLLPYKIHTRPIYMAALVVWLLIERRAIGEIVGTIFRSWQEVASRSWGWASLALIAVAISLTTAWLPSILFDELAYHLMLPAQLVELGYYRFDVATQVWAIAPWSSDIVHAMVSVLADAESRGAVNVGWFALACCALWRFGGLIGLGERWRWLGIALYASQPYISGLLGTAQVENMLVPLTVVLASLCVKVCRDKDPNALYAVVILAGLFASLKSSQVLVIAPLLLVCAPVLLKAEPRKLLAACVVALLFGSSSYVYAWYLTGNPLLPLFNGYFKSPFFQSSNFRDLRWSQGMNWRSLWDLTFDSGKYQEINVGGAGLSVLALSPFLLATLRYPALRRTTIWLLIALVGMFGAIQYLRYIAPLLVVTILLALYSMDRLLSPRVGAWAITCLVIANLLLIPTSTWALKNGLLGLQLRSLVKKDDSRQIVKTYAFESLVAASLLRGPLEPGSVLLADRSRPFTAQFAGRAFAESWYDPEMQAAGALADADLTGARWVELLQTKGMRYVLAPTGLPDRPALAAALDASATVVMKGPGQTLYCLCDIKSDAAAATSRDALYTARDFGRRLRIR